MHGKRTILPCPVNLTVAETTEGQPNGCRNHVSDGSRHHDPRLAGRRFSDAQAVATSDGVLENQQYWRLLSAIAVHSDLVHLLSNAIFLAFFPYLLYGYFGFWVFPVMALSLASLTNYLSLLAYPYGVGLLGASGLVYWMVGFWLCVYLLVDRTLGLGKRVMRALLVALVVLFPTRYQEGVGYRIHAIGFGLGVGAALVYFQRNRESIRAAEVVEVEDPATDPE